MSDQKEQEIILNTPKNLNDFSGQFVVFFSQDSNPNVLFSSFIAEEAYSKAEEIKSQYKKDPVVLRVQENSQNNIAQVLAVMHF